MGLIINKQNKAFGVDIDQLYLRLGVRIDFNGVIDIYVRCYASRYAYDENINNFFRVDGIQNMYRHKDEKAENTLQFAHERLIKELTTELTETRTHTTVDEKGQESTKETEVVIKEKFCEATDIVNELNQSTKK